MHKDIVASFPASMHNAIGWRAVRTSVNAVVV